MKGSTFNSQTHGEIPLSIEARNLMEALRVSIVRAIKCQDYGAGNVAHARGELAMYISKLEHPRKVGMVPELAAPYIDEKGGMTATEVMMRQREGKKALDAAISDGFEKFSRTWLIPNQDIFWAGKDGVHTLSGLKATMTILDDPQSENDMKKAKATLKKKAAKFQAVGVRFLTGHNLATIYTYKAKRSAKLHLGQEVVVRNSNGTSVAVVVDLPPEFPVNYTVDTTVELTLKVAAL